MNAKRWWMVAGSGALLLLLFTISGQTPEPVPPVATTAPQVSSSARQPVPIPAYAPAYVDGRHPPPEPLPRAVVRDDTPLLALGEGDAAAQERQLQRMMREYDAVRAYPEQRQAHRDEMRARLAAYSQAIAPIALAQAAAYQAEHPTAGGY